MLKLRLLSAGIGMPVIFFIVWSGGWLLTAGLAVLALLGWREFTALTKAAGFELPEILGGFLVLLFLLIAYLESSGVFLGMFGSLPAAGLLLTAVALVICYPKLGLSEIALTLWGPLYIGGLLSYWIWLRDLSGGFYWIIGALLLTWAYDSGAYFVGRRWGRHKPWPKLSPNKTLEGVAGGLFASTIIFLLVSRVFLYTGGPAVGLGLAIGLGLTGGVVAQLGDLLESAIKRQAGVKDSGSLIPGHGGILDRFDSLLLVMPFVYFWVSWAYFNP
jgi:phosphatidate cytidylyltransferase